MEGFDWVDARSKCSIGVAFQRLRAQLKDDVDARNAKRPEGAQHKFECITHGEFVTVLLGGNNIKQRSVVFKQTTRGINVLDDQDAVVLEATPTLNDEGVCCLDVRGQQREFWQFRRMALEKLFFETV
ncbi:MAG: hypothetical protein ABSF98_12155 [Bryobacteraceae bacterium]|jgi:hypothetical protein